MYIFLQHNAMCVYSEVSPILFNGAYAFKSVFRIAALGGGPSNPYSSLYPGTPWKSSKMNFPGHLNAPPLIMRLKPVLIAQ